MKQLSLLPDLVQPKEIINPVEIIKSRTLPTLPIVVSYGGGTNSTALLIAARIERVEIDTIIFADTGNEHPRTYEFLAWFDSWLQHPWEFDGKTYPPMTGITVVKKPFGNAGRRHKLEAEARQEYYDLPVKNLNLFCVALSGWLVKYWLRLYAVGENLGEECLIQGRLPSKAYGYGACSKKYKVVPIENFIAAKYGNQQIIQWVGIHSGELARLFDKNGKAKPLETSLGFIDYPLIKKGLSQAHCEALCRLLPRYPGKSSCWFCPNARVHEVLQLKKEYPDLYELGCFMEK